VAARFVDGVEGRAFGAETPQPDQSPVEVPAGLIGVEHGGVQAFVPDLLVPGLQGLSEAMPHLCEAALGDFELEMRVIDIHDLTGGGTDTIVEECRKGHSLIAECASGHGVGDLGFDLFLAAGAPVAVNCVFGGFGLEVGGNVFDDSSAGAFGASEFAAAFGAVWELMFDAFVDVLWFGPGVSLMAGLGAGLAATLFRCRFLEGGYTAGGSVWRAFGGDGCRQLQEQEASFDWIAVEKLLGLGFGENAGTEGVQKLGIELGGSW